MLHLAERYEEEVKIQQCGRRQRRKEAQGALLDFIPGRRSPGGRIIHYCDIGCNCRDVDEAFERLMGMVDVVLLDLTVSSPALNRWNTVLGCLLWWLFGALLFNVLPLGLCPPAARHLRRRLHR